MKAQQSISIAGKPILCENDQIPSKLTMRQKEQGVAPSLTGAASSKISIGNIKALSNTCVALSGTVVVIIIRIRAHASAGDIGVGNI